MLFLCSLLSVMAQQVSISGSVTDNKTGESVIGAGVLLKGTTTGVATDLDGKFTLQNVKIGDVLVISSIGYLPSEVTVSGTRAVYDILLEPDTQTLDESVVIGFGSQRKADLTDAVATVDTKALDSRPVTSLDQALQGTVPGLNISVGNYGGQLGQNMSVNIRGTGTISTGSTASTLVLIDGIEGNMNNLNPDDIESISVLKDAASAAIYGSRAAFGVILITTKKGKAGRASVSYAGNVRYAGPNELPDMMNSWDFANYYNEANVNGGSQPYFNEDTMTRIRQYMAGEITTTTIANGNNWQFNTYANDNVDWYRTHFKWAWSHEHNLNINGGSEKAQYYVSANYLDQNGNLRYGNDKYNRLSTNVKLNAQPYEWLEIEANVKYVNTKLDNPFYTDQGGLLYHDIARIWPIMPFKDPNGHYMRNGKIPQLVSGSRSVTNTDNVYMQGQLIFKPLKDWKIYASVGYRMINTYRAQNLNRVYEYTVDNQPSAISFSDSYAANQTGAFQYWLRAGHLTTSLYTDYVKSINRHNFSVMAGINTESYNNRVANIQRMDLITELIPEIGAATGEDRINDASAYSWATAGIFGRVTYDFDRRYFIKASLRYDGSSRFLREDRWGLFGSVSAGWNIAAEKFFPLDDNIMSQLKPRVSWGTLGNQNMNSYYPMYLTQSITVNGGSWVMNGEKPTIASPPGVVSNSLTWETVESINVGADLAMLNDRLTANFDYFIRNTKNMIGPASEIASIFGTSMPNTNNTDLQTKGWELAVNWKDNAGEFNYSVGFNISDSRSFVTRYPNASKSLSTYYEGQELGQIWGYVTHGIAKSNEEMAAWIENNNPSWGSSWAEGDIMYTDLNGDKVINSGANTLDDHGDLKLLGNSTPRYRYGINLGLDWKGIDFSMFWQGVAKRDVPLSGNIFWGVVGDVWQSSGFEEHKDYYRPENTDSVFGPNTDAYFPRPVMGSTKNQQTQSRYIRSGAYLRLKNIQLGYTLPKKVLDKMKIQYLRIYVSAENVLTFDSLPEAFDPETLYSAYGSAFNGKTYPLSSTVSLGLNITF